MTLRNSAPVTVATWLMYCTIDWYSVPRSSLRASMKLSVSITAPFGLMSRHWKSAQSSIDSIPLTLLRASPAWCRCRHGGHRVERQRGVGQAIRLELTTVDLGTLAGLAT